MLKIPPTPFTRGRNGLRPSMENFSIFSETCFGAFYHLHSGIVDVIWYHVVLLPQKGGGDHGLDNCCDPFYGII